MKPDRPFTKEQRDFHDVLLRSVGEFPAIGSVAEFPQDKWTAAAQCGALALTHPDTGADAMDVVATGEALGYAGFPGPWWQTVLIVSILEGELAESVMAGETIVTAGWQIGVPWAAQADRSYLLGEYDATGWTLHQMTLSSAPSTWVSLGFEPVVGASDATIDDRVVVPWRSAMIARLALASYLSGAGRRVLDDVVAYAQQRTQFETRLADFTAVSHPLAEIEIGLRAAALLARRAASEFDEVGDVARSEQLVDGRVHAALRASADAARRAVYQAHQTYGGIGFSTEGPLTWLGQRIGQLSTEAQKIAKTADLVAAVVPGAV